MACMQQGLLKFYTVPMCLLAVINFVIQITRVIFFFCENMISFLNNVIATLRAVTRIKYSDEVNVATYIDMISFWILVVI